MNMFEPKNNIPYWEMVYNHIKDKEVGESISYKELSEVLGENIEKNRSAVYKARNLLLETDNKFLDIERGVGYKVIDGMNVVKHAKGHQKSAKRKIMAASFEVENIDTKKLDPIEKKKLQDFMTHNSSIQAVFTNKINRIEKATEVVDIAQEFTRNEIEELRGMISK